MYDIKNVYVLIIYFNKLFIMINVYVNWRMCLFLVIENYFDRYFVLMGKEVDCLFKVIVCIN